MINHILKQENQILLSILKKVEELKHFNRLFFEHLEPSSTAHCQIVKFENNCLFVIVDNGAWATQLRFHIPELMIKLKQYPELSNLKGIICKIRPKHVNPSLKRRTRHLPHMTSKTSEAIIKAAETIKDTRLRKILEKIAAHSFDR